MRPNYSLQFAAPQTPRAPIYQQQAAPMQAPQQGYMQQQMPAVDVPNPAGYGSGFTGWLTSPDISQGLISAGSAILAPNGNMSSAFGGFNQGMQASKQQRIENAIKSRAASATLGGGATGALIQQRMAATGEDYETAFAAVKTNLANQGLNYQNGGVGAIPGYIGTKAQIAGAESGAKQNAQNSSDLNYATPIKAAQAEGTEIGKKQGELKTKEIAAPQVLNLLSEAKTLLPKASSGRLESIGAGANSIIGRSTEATQANKKLERIAADLTLNVPRMEGPQGVLDLQLYQKAAADVGNPNIPYKDRLAAVEQSEIIASRYLRNTTNGDKSQLIPSGAQVVKSKGGHTFQVIKKQ